MALKPAKTITWPTILVFIFGLVLSVFLSLKPTPPVVLGSVGAGLIFFGWLCWYLAKKWDRKNAILDSAPLIPMKFLEVDDDAWVMGSAQTNTPVYIPFFQYEALHYFYRLEHYVTKTRSKSDGTTETYSEWETRETDSNQTDFQIFQDSSFLSIKGKEAQFCHEKTESETKGFLRHSCTFLPNHCHVYAVGVVGEGKHFLTAKAHVPLIITTKTRDEFLEAAEQSEQNAKNMGFLFFLFGSFLLCMILFSQWHELAGNGFGNTRGGIVLFSSIGAFLLTSILGFIHLFNRMIIFRSRARERWSQIDVNLKQRHDLLPNIAGILSASKAHESAVHELVARTRSLALLDNQKQQIANEKNLAEGISRLIALGESYPELKTNSGFLKASNDMIALENKIAHARELFNFAVMEFNSQAESFPTNLFAGTLGFSKQDYFSV